MDPNTTLSEETQRFITEYQRGMSIKDSLPDTAQAMALCTVKMTNDLVEAVAQIVQRDAVIVTLQQGRRVLIDFSSADTPITAESLQQAREELNSSGYSLLVGKVSEYSCKLLVGKHSPLSRRQSRLLWLAPSTVLMTAATAWARAWRKLFEVSPKVDTRNERIDRKSTSKLSKSNAANLLKEAERREAEEEERQRSAAKRARRKARKKERAKQLAEQEKQQQQCIADKKARKKEQIQLLAKQELQEAAGREERDNEILLRFDLLQRGELGYAQPWALSRKEDRSYWLNPNFVCRSKRIGTFDMAVMQTSRGLIVYLPPNFDDLTKFEQANYKCFHSCQDNFEWFQVRIAGRS